MVGVSKVVPPQKKILNNIYLSFFYGAKIGVLGLNGAGKSTVLRIMAGLDKEYNGKITMTPGFTIGYLEQEPLLGETQTVWEIVKQGAQEQVDLLEEFNEINAKFAEPLNDDEMNQLIERQGEVQGKLDELDAWDIESRLEMAMDALRCPPGDTPVNLVSGGERRRVALCRLLLSAPDMLILDEPTNHLDIQSREVLLEALQKYCGTVVLVSHDRHFLRSLATRVFELDHGEMRIYEGNYAYYQSKSTANQQV